MKKQRNILQRKKQDKTSEKKKKNLKKQKIKLPDNFFTLHGNMVTYQIWEKNE